MNFKTLFEDLGFILVDCYLVLIDFEMIGDFDMVKDCVQSIFDMIVVVQVVYFDFVIEEFGVASVDKQFGGVFMDDFKKVGEFFFLIMFGILFFIFGVFVAVGILLLFGLMVVIVMMGLFVIFSKIFFMDESIGVVIFLIGFVVGVDYTMFYLKWECEECVEGKSEEEVFEIVVVILGCLVFIFGLIVMIVMVGMFLIGDLMFKGFGVVMIFVVVVVVFGLLMVLSVVFLWFGDWVEWLYILVLKSMKFKYGESRFWSVIFGSVFCYLILVVLFVGGFFVVLCFVVL